MKDRKETGICVRIEFAYAVPLTSHREVVPVDTFWKITSPHNIFLQMALVTKNTFSE